MPLMSGSPDPYRLVLLGIQGLPHSLHPVLPLYNGVEGRHVDGDSDEDSAPLCDRYI